MIAQVRETLGDTESENLLLEEELATIRRGIDAVVVRVIEALNAVVEMESPYPPELREVVYEAARYATEAGQASYALDWTILVYW